MQIVVIPNLHDTGRVHTPGYKFTKRVIAGARELDIPVTENLGNTTASSGAITGLAEL